MVLAMVVPMRARALSRQDEQVHRQERILSAAAFAADRFASEGTLVETLPDVLERIGRATAASRVYIFENTRDRQGQVLMSIRHEWCAADVRTTVGDATNQRFPYTAGYLHWQRKLTDGQPVQVRRSEASGTEREDMEAEGSLSIAAVPVYVAGDWWGFLGIDDCTVEREWSTGELEALTVAAATYGAAVTRERWLGELAEAEERFRILVEQSPTVVYIDALDAVAATRYISPQIETITGYSPDDWIGDPELWIRLLNEEDRAEVMAAQEHHNETGEPFRMEYRLRTKVRVGDLGPRRGRDDPRRRRLVPPLAGRDARHHRGAQRAHPDGGARVPGRADADPEPPGVRAAHRAGGQARAARRHGRRRPVRRHRPVQARERLARHRGRR